MEDLHSMVFWLWWHPQNGSLTVFRLMTCTDVHFGTCRLKQQQNNFGFNEVSCRY